MDISLIFPLLILLLFIPLFLSGRKQRRQMQEMQQLQSSLAEGDTVITTSGLRGTVVDASYEETVDIEIAEGVVTTWVRAAVRQKIEEGDPAGEADDTTADGPAIASADDAAGPSTGAAESAPPSLQKPTGTTDDRTGGANRA